MGVSGYKKKPSWRKPGTPAILDHTTLVLPQHSETPEAEINTDRVFIIKKLCISTNSWQFHSSLIPLNAENTSGTQTSDFLMPRGMTHWDCAWINLLLLAPADPRENQSPFPRHYFHGETIISDWKRLRKINVWDTNWFICMKKVNKEEFQWGGFVFFFFSKMSMGK